MPHPIIVRLHVLGTDVDIHVEGELEKAGRLATTVRDRWHLALRDDDRALRADDLAPAAPPAIVTVALGSVEDEQVRGDSVVHDTDERRLLQRLTQSVTFAAIRARSGELLMLHAAALADPATGATVGFVAPGNTGKTTLCRTLGPSRAYVTDETLGVRRDGTITPYLKPLSTRRPDWMGVKDEQAPGSLGLRPPQVTPWLAGLVLLRRDPEHLGPPEVEAFGLLDAVMALVPESSAFMSTDRPLQWLADVLDRTGGARRVRYAEVQDLEPLASEMLGRGSPW